METMALKRTMIFLDPEDHRALFERALDESRRQGRRVTMAEMIRQAVKAYLVRGPEIQRKRETRPTKKAKG
jgi:hypothetical protein